MANKQIRLRGISMAPSDRNNSDGGCAESLNLFLDQDELATMQPPRNTELLSSSAPCRYIHKTTGYTNYICVGTDGKTIYNGTTQVRNLGEVVRDIASNGNLLLVSTSSHIHYILYKDSAYVYLGTRIPEPDLVFQTEDIDSGKSQSWTPVLMDKTSQANSVDYELAIMNSGTWANAAADEAPEYRYYCEQIWGHVNTLMATARKQYKAFAGPTFVRFALRLYTGDLYYQSVPVLLGPMDSWLYAYGKVTWPSGQEKPLPSNATFTVAIDPFKAKVRINNSTSEWTAWKDIIQSIDIFAAPTVCNPAINSKVRGLAVDSTISVTGDDYAYRFTFRDEYSDDRDGFENAMLAASNFYLIDSIPFDKFTECTTTARELKPLSNDDLLVKSPMQDDQRSHIETVPLSGMREYNERLMVFGTKETLGRGHLQLQTLSHRTGGDTGTFQYKYYVRTQDGKTHIVLGNSLTTPSGYNVRGLIFYPDSRCYRVDIKAGSTCYTCEMRPHPSLDCAYAYWGIDQTISDLGTTTDTDFTNESREYSFNGQLYMSEVADPFVFPLTNRQSYTDEVLTAAAITKPLSTGQFGQYDIYTFTKGGIWALGLTSSGTFASSHPVSYDVALSADSVMQIDQAIVFTTKKGVMMLTGSDVTELSPNMHGDRFMLDEDSRGYLSGGTWASLLIPLTDDTGFHTFMSNARCVYDYKGGRLIFMHPQLRWQYVLCLASRTWHRMYFGSNVQVYSVLNSYPESYCSVHDGTSYKIYDYSQPVESSSTTRVAGAVITRALDFDSPFLYKTLRRLYIRGYRAMFDNDDECTTKYMILASNDGVNYGLVGSLRGKSYRFYRLVVLSNLLPYERLSWIDVDYEERYLNKIR